MQSPSVSETHARRAGRANLGLGYRDPLYFFADLLNLGIHIA
jgi:hypothetical protein